MVSLAIVAAFLLMIVLSATGLIAKDWAKEVGVNYAPPTFVGPEAATAPSGAAPGAAGAAAPDATESEVDREIPDPLADALAAIEAGAIKPGEAPPAAPDARSVDPLADVMADIKAQGNRARPMRLRRARRPCPSAATNGAATS